MTDDATNSSNSSSNTTLPPDASFKHPDDERLLRRALQTSLFFSCLDDDQVERLVAAAQLREYAPNDIVILEGCVDSDDDNNDGDYHHDPGESSSASETDDEQRLRLQQVHLQRQASASHGPADVDELLMDADQIEDHDGKNRGKEEGSNGVDEDGIQLRDDATVAIDIINPAMDASHAGSNSQQTDPAAMLQQPPRDLKDTAADQSGDSSMTDDRKLGGGYNDDEPSKDKSHKSASHTSASTSVSTLPQSTAAQHDSTITVDNNLGNNDNNEDSNDNNNDSTPPPPQSGIPRALYIVRQGRADVWYKAGGLNPVSLGPGTCFGEGGFLFGRQHSASVVARGPLQCWVVDSHTFRNHVLPSQSMTQLFRQHAKRQDERGQYYLTMEEFVQACNDQDQFRNGSSSGHSNSFLSSSNDPLLSFRIVNMYNVLSRRAKGGDKSSDKIYLPDFCLFHLLISRPDPEVDIAFLLMDQRQAGQIYLDDLKRFLQPVFPNLDFTSQFFERYFGGGSSDKNKRKYSIRQAHFSQFLVDLQREIGKQMFLQAVQEFGREGCLAPEDFVRVIKASCGWRLPQGVVDRLEGIYCRGPDQPGEAVAESSVRSGTYQGASDKEVARATEKAVLGAMEQREKQFDIRYFNYADFLAFQEVLALLPGICNVIDRAQEIKKGPISQDDFKVANKAIGLGSRLSRRQVEIIFSMFDLDRDGFVAHDDTVSVCGVYFAQQLAPEVGRGGALTFAPPPKFRQEATENIEEPAKSPISSESLSQISISAFAGALGVIALYPLDLIKTRLMNQRLTAGSNQLYANSVDCFRQVLRSHGPAGLYRGLIPQLLGSAPEKAIKLHVNDLILHTFKSSDDDTNGGGGNVLVEALAGACAGACQLLVSNPMELSKTRLILQDEMSQLLKARNIEPPRSLTFTQVVRDLGFPQIQVHGATACLLRDIPFSAIYFPGYAACKRYLAETRHDGRATMSDLLTAGTLAAVPSSLLTTPCDVIRVRLQAIPRPGEVAYAGIRDCATRIYAQEGIQAFFQGALPRVLRIAPQFGISLVAYEQLTNGLGFPSASRPPTNAPIDPRDYRTAFPTGSTILPQAVDIDGWMRSFGTKPPRDPSDKK